MNNSEDCLSKEEILCLIKDELSKQNEEDQKDSLDELCLVEFKSQSYASFYNTTMEKDKSILTLSVAGLGFLMAVIQLLDAISSTQVVLISIGALCFLMSILAVITIFSMNASYIVQLTNDIDTSVKGYQLKVLDNTAVALFFLGIIISIVIGATTLIDKMESNEVSKEKETISQEQKNHSSEVQQINESYDRANELAINSFQLANQIKSTNGAASMKPKSTSQRDTASAPSNIGSSAQDLKPKV